MQADILILTTGGTIDKVYFDAKSAYAVGDPQIAEVLRQAHVDLAFDVVPLMRKDSLELTLEDRKAMLAAIQAHPHQRVLLTHGTDTMTETGCFLQQSEGRTIVLTGALLPARFRDNDAIFNIGFAFAAVQVLPPGVYICMNGQVYDPRKVRKDRPNNRFIAI
jgi:L-asparaginase